MHPSMRSANRTWSRCAMRSTRRTRKSATVRLQGLRCPHRTEGVRTDGVCRRRIQAGTGARRADRQDGEARVDVRLLTSASRRRSRATAEAVDQGAQCIESTLAKDGRTVEGEQAQAQCEHPGRYGARAGAKKDTLQKRLVCCGPRSRGAAHVRELPRLIDRSAVSIDHRSQALQRRSAGRRTPPLARLAMNPAAVGPTVDVVRSPQACSSVSRGCLRG